MTTFQLDKCTIYWCVDLLRIGVWSVGGMPLVTVIKNTVMFNMVEIPRVIFSPDSAGIRKKDLAIRCEK